MPVKILKSKKGNIFETTKRVGLLYITVEEIPADTNTNRNVQLAGDKLRRVALIFRTKEQFDAIFNKMGIFPVEGTILEGIVAVKEQLKPLNASDPLYGIKYTNTAAKNAGLMCTVRGMPVYRDTFYTTNENTEDVLMQYENQNEIEEHLLSKGITRRFFSDDNSVSYVDIKESYSYPDGYGGYVNDDLIDDALGGEPDAYWNLD